MRKGVVTIDGMSTAKEAAAKMRSEKVAYILVEKRDSHDAWGILAVRDLIKGVMIAGRPSTDVHVYEIMTKPIITVPADMNIRYVARLIFQAGIGRAPVEDAGKIVGTISLYSLVLDNEFF
jgi:CBS domain-containing protein